MTLVEQLDGAKVVGVWRQCRVCAQWKPLEHYKRTGGKHGTTIYVKVCAACRRAS